jgi:chromosome segregation ATPase
MLSLHHHRPLYTTSVQLNSQPAPPSPSSLIEKPRSMDEQLSLPIHDSFEFEAEMIIMQEQVTAAQDEGNRTKQQLRDAETELERAEALKEFCLNEAKKHKQEYDVRLDVVTEESSAAQDRHVDQLAGKVSEITQLRSKLQATEAQKAKHEDHEKFLEAKINSSNHMIKALKLQLQAASSTTNSGGQASRRKRTHNESTRYGVMKLNCDTSNTNHCNLRVETAKNARPITKKAKTSDTQALPEGSLE